MGCPDAIKRLVERFDHQLDQVRSPSYNEAQLRIDFINPMFRELGWDIDNVKGSAEQYREVVYEDRVRVAGANKAPDYSFRIGSSRKFFLEAKKPYINLKEAWEPAYQLRRYAWSAKLAVSLLTDFEELAVYDCRVQPKQFDKPSTARREYMTYRQYQEKWDFLAGTFSNDAVRLGDFDRYCGSTRARGAQEFDEAFLEEIEGWRKDLASNLALRNESLDERSLNFAVQRIIDRIIFLRICEDRGIEHVGQLRALMNSDQIYSRLFKLFRDADTRYNSGLFHFKPEPGRDEQPDELTPALEVDDATLKSIIKRLYYPESPYEFTVVSADILGSIYERFLGKVITLTAGHRARIEEKPEVRKAGGVYYTPTYIVDYIVQHTVGKLLEGKTPKEAAELKILDPACGSGSFLIGAYQYLLDWHLNWYAEHQPEKWAKGKEARLRPARPNEPPPGLFPPAPPTKASESWRLTIQERKRILLNNIHGVDIDHQAVEVTKLSLLLKVLEGETAESLGGYWTLYRERALPDLGRNIQCGNTLIGTDIMTTDAWHQMSEDERRRVNPFEFERSFAQVFQQGGFDAVIGNPPYIRMEEFKAIKEYLRPRFSSHSDRADLYVYFIERGRGLLRSGGAFAMIVSNKFIKAKYGSPLRGFLTKPGTELEIVDFAGLPVFPQATVRTVIVSTMPNDGPGFSFRYCAPPPISEFEKIAAGSETVASYARGHTATLPVEPTQLFEWNLASAEAHVVARKLREVGMRLAEYIPGPICYGVKSGLVEAFVVQQSTGQHLRALGAAYREVVRPLLTGREIDRYTPAVGGKFILYLSHGVRVDAIPEVLAHLRPFKSRLQARATQQEWYELQQPQEAYVQLMSHPKIVYPDIAKDCRFTIDNQGHICGDTAFALPLDDRFVLGLLNSRVASYYFAMACAALEGAGERYLRFKTQYVAEFPIPTRPHPTARSRVVELVDGVLDLHRRERAAKLPQEKEQLRRQIEATDRQIDQFVYELYGLTDAEIRVVEEAGPFPTSVLNSV